MTTGVFLHPEIKRLQKKKNSLWLISHQIITLGNCKTFATRYIDMCARKVVYLIHVYLTVTNNVEISENTVISSHI